MGPAPNRRSAQARKTSFGQRPAWHPVLRSPSKEDPWESQAETPAFSSAAAESPAFLGKKAAGNSGEILRTCSEEPSTADDESDSASTDQGVARSHSHGGAASLSTSSSAENLLTTPLEATYARSELLRVRDLMFPGGCHKVRTTSYSTAKVARRSSGKPAALTTPPQSPASTCASASEQLLSSPTSWAMLQKLRRQNSGETAKAQDGFAPESPVSDAEIRRRVKSILNKLTPEKFDKLLVQMAQCGACTCSHLDTLAQAIFQEASMQHNFAGMYADLCACLVVSFGEGGCFLGSALLNQCWELFRESLQPEPEALDSEDLEAAQEARTKHHKRAIGNAKFMGELFIRDMLFAPELFTCTEMLLKQPLSNIALESLCTLLTVIGPFFDIQGWELHAQLVEVFWQVRGLTFDPSLNKRVKCLLRDVLDLRDAGWINMKTATKVERPKRLDEVRAECAQKNMDSEAAKNSSRKASRQQRAPPSPAAWSSPSPSCSAAWSPMPSPMQTPVLSPSAPAFTPMSSPKQAFAPEPPAWTPSLEGAWACWAGS